jgi:hypothetical protein
VFVTCRDDVVAGEGNIGVKSREDVFFAFFGETREASVEVY